MKQLVINLIVCGGALFIHPALSKAESYILSYSLVANSYGTIRGSKAPKRPLVIDLTDNTFTFPNQVVGCTFTLEGEAGSVYNYYIIDTTFTLPQKLSGEYSITVSDGNNTYRGIVNIG